MYVMDKFYFWLILYIFFRTSFLVVDWVGSRSGEGGRVLVRFLALRFVMEEHSFTG